MNVPKEAGRWACLHSWGDGDSHALLLPASWLSRQEAKRPQSNGIRGWVCTEVAHFALLTCLLKRLLPPSPSRGFKRAARSLAQRGSRLSETVERLVSRPLDGSLPDEMTLLRVEMMNMYDL